MSAARNCTKPVWKTGAEKNRFVNLFGLVLDQELSLKLLLLSIKVHMERHQNIKKIFLRLKNPLK